MIDIFTVLIVIASWAYTHVKTYQTVHFKCMYFIVCFLYLSEVVKVIFFFFFSLKKCVKIEAGRKTVEQLEARLTPKTASIIIQHSRLEL